MLGFGLVLLSDLLIFYVFFEWELTDFSRPHIVRTIFIVVILCLFGFTLATQSAIIFFEDSPVPYESAFASLIRHILCFGAFILGLLHVVFAYMIFDSYRDS